MPLTPTRGGDQHREARGAWARSRCARCPASPQPVPTVCTERRRGDAARRRTRPSAPASCSRSTRPRPTPRCIGGNIAMNAGGKKAVLWGTALDNLASWRMVDARRQLARGRRASTTTSARSTTRRSARFASDALRRRRQARSSAPSVLDIPGARFRKAGLGKDVTDKFLGGLPGVQKEGCDGLITSARWVAAPHAAAHAHRVPGVLRPGARGGAGHRRDQATTSTREPRRRAARRPRAPRRALPARRSATRPRRKRGAAAEDGAARRHRRRRRGRRGARRLARWCASPTRAAARASSPSAPRRARSSGSTARAPRPSPGTPTPSRSTRTW
ncbi:MAG: hypothetical protein MZW92_78400 [Comamonadaceae bacterium]|nr:hypothetical protein [Comamonadaceae bacterium]